MAIDKIIDRAATISVSSISGVTNTSTGGFDIPSGTTAQRPSSPDSGYMRFNTTINAIEVYDGTSWRTNASTGKSIAMTMVFG